MDDLDASLHPDGILRYRRDADGTRVGIIHACA
jgi:YD repeat-containing protein